MIPIDPPLSGNNCAFDEDRVIRAFFVATFSAKQDFRKTPLIGFMRKMATVRYYAGLVAPSLTANYLGSRSILAHVQVVHFKLDQSHYTK